jgi:hypothetical protein
MEVKTDIQHQIAMRKSYRFLGFAAIVVAFALVATPVLAQNNNNDTRPGWGFGDQNHVHTGPPGQSVRAVHISNSANVANALQVDNHGNNAAFSVALTNIFNMVKSIFDF